MLLLYIKSSETCFVKAKHKHFLLHRPEVIEAVVFTLGLAILCDTLSMVLSLSMVSPMDRECLCCLCICVTWWFLLIAGQSYGLESV